MTRPAPDKDNKFCSICGLRYVEYGNNAWPINGSRCCNRCNDFYVIPRRIADMLRQRRLDAEAKESEK